MEPTSLPTVTGDIATSENIKVPMLEPAFTWGSSSTIAADEDNASDVTMASQDSDPSGADAQTKEVETPSTPKAAALFVSSPQRPSKTATSRCTPFTQPTKLDYNFVMGTTSPSISPSRLPRSPLRSPKKISDASCSSDKENSPPKPAALPSLLDRIAMAASSPSTPKLGKRRASNVPTDSPPKKKNRGGRVARKSNDDDGDGRGDRAEDDSEAEREEVRKSLLSPVTPSSAAQRHAQHAAILTAFATEPPRSLLRPCSRSPSPTPQPPQHKRKRKSVFMDAVVITKPRSAEALCKTRRSVRSDEKTVLSPPPLAPLSLSSSSGDSGLVAHQNMRRAKSLSTFMSGADVPDRPPMSAPPVVAHRPGKRQKGYTTPAALLAMKTKNPKAWTAELKGSIAAAKTTIANVTVDDDDVFATSTALCSSSPITATLKRARVLFGSGKSIICPVLSCPVLSCHPSTSPVPPALRPSPLATFCFCTASHWHCSFTCHCPRRRPSLFFLLVQS